MFRQNEGKINLGKNQTNFLSHNVQTKQDVFTLISEALDNFLSHNVQTKHFVRAESVNELIPFPTFLSHNVQTKQIDNFCQFANLRTTFYLTMFRQNFYLYLYMLVHNFPFYLTMFRQNWIGCSTRMKKKNIFLSHNVQTKQ